MPHLEAFLLIVLCIKFFMLLVHGLLDLTLQPKIRETSNGKQVGAH